VRRGGEAREGRGKALSPRLKEEGKLGRGEEMKEGWREEEERRGKGRKEREGRRT
jgi:hypothetical protein